MSEAKAIPVPESLKPEVPGKMSVPKSGKTAPTVEVVGLGTFAAEPQKPEKAAEAKAAPAAEPQKPKTAEKASEAKATTKQKKSDAAAKVADVKATSATEVPTKISSEKPSPAIGQKEPDIAANAADTKAPSATEAKKPVTQEKAPTAKAISAAEPKKTEAPTKAVDPNPSTPAPEQKEAQSPAKSTSPEAAASSSKAADGPKGVVVTQVFADRLDYPDEAALQSLPIPKEGKGFSMRLHPAYFFQFLDHPFSINREVKDYRELYDSIKENGINEPIKARPRGGGGLELLSGHRRHDVAMQLNYPVPVVIVQADDDTARIEVVDGNLHRQDIPTSELARAAKMKMEALARKAGRRSKMEQLSGLPPKRTDELVAEDMGMSRNQVNRLVRIDSLVPELKQQVDDKKLPFNTAVELSYMKPEEQSKVVDFMAKEQVVPSMAQATALKEASRQAAKNPTPTAQPKPAVDEQKIASIVKPKKEPELRVTFTGAELAGYFPDATPTVSQVKRTVFEALDLRKKALDRQAKKQELRGVPKTPER